MYVTRCNQKKIFESFHSPFISAVLGPRRVGKSTLVEYFLAQQGQKNCVALNMDIRAERLRVEAEQLATLITERARQKIGPDSPLLVCIDEAQKCPALFEQIKVLYDRFKGTPALKFILTGSGFLNLHRLAAETLAGRIELHHLREFNLQESVALLEGKDLELPSLLDALLQRQSIASIGQVMASLSPHRTVLEQGLREQMVWGGLPEVLENSDEVGKISYLGNYLQTYLEKDVRDIATISDLGLYQRMMEVIAQQTGSIRDDKRLVDALGCSRDTLKKYRGYLEATLVYREIFPYIGTTLRRLVKSPKGYLSNNGLISYLTGVYDHNALTQTGAIGHRFENWVLREIQVALDRNPKKSEVYFWRTSGGMEVDLVVAQAPWVFPMEITTSSQKDRRKIKHLARFLAEEPKAPLACYVYQGEWEFDEAARILFLPAWALG